MRTISTSLFLLPVIALGQARPSSPVVVTTPSDGDRARIFLNESLNDKNPDTRKQGVQALGLVGPREPYISQVESMLDDKDLEVRLAAIASQVDLKNKRTVPALQKTLEMDVPEVSFAAAKALWTLNEAVGREALISVLSGETKTSSGFVTKQKREALRMLHTPKPMFMFALKTGIGFAPVPGLGAGISSVQGILADPGVSGRAATALLLSSDSDPTVLRALQDALEDKDWSVRASAVHAIALRNDPTLKKDLVPLLEDKNGAVRVRAAAGYLRLEWIESTRPKTTSKQRPKKQPAGPASGASKN